MVYQGIILLLVHVSEFVSGREGKLSLLWASVDGGKFWNRAGLQGRKRNHFRNCKDMIVSLTMEFLPHINI